MNKLLTRSLFLVILGALLLSSVVIAADGSGVDKQKRLDITTSKELEAALSEPVPWLEWGADIRLRAIYAENFIAFNKDAPGNIWNFQRYRTRLWGNFKLDDDVKFNSRLVWEFRTWDEPKERPLGTGSGTDFDEILFDKFNLEFDNAFGTGAKLTVGRQDLIFGDGWLILDGTPLDGSRTIFFDAIRLTFDLDDSDTTVDAIYIDQAAAADRWLKPINDRENNLTEQDERGAIIYLTNKSVPDTDLSAYFIYKNDDKVASNGNDADIYTFGGRIAKMVDENWRYRAEGALQTGNKNGEDICAMGFNSRLSYFTNDSVNNNFRLAYEYLSGDDPGSSRNEAFDPLWGRWPQFSELYIYSYIPETRIAETTNFHRLGMGWSFNPNDKIEFCTDYHLLFADQNTRKSSAGFSSNGNFRGQLLALLMKYKISKNISGHLLSEFFFPGNYYDKTSNDPATFLRAEIVYKF